MSEKIAITRAEKSNPTIRVLIMALVTKYGDFHLANCCTVAREATSIMSCQGSSEVLLLQVVKCPDGGTFCAPGTNRLHDSNKLWCLERCHKLCLTFIFDSPNCELLAPHRCRNPAS